VSKEAFDIPGVGPKIIDKLLEEGLITDASDLFVLTEGDLEPLERMAEKSAKNIVAAIQSKKEITLDRLIYALGIRHVGLQTAFDLAKRYGDLKKLEEIELDELTNIENIGEVVAKSIFDFFHDPKARLFIDKLLNSGIKYRKIKNVGKLNNRSFLITGGLEKFSRVQAGELIRQNGGRLVSTVSADLDFLVVGSKPGSKLAKARELGVKILTESDFISLLESTE
jgi:DNA ligase (NAD+)